MPASWRRVESELSARLGGPAAAFSLTPIAHGVPRMIARSRAKRNRHARQRRRRGAEYGHGRAGQCSRSFVTHGLSGSLDGRVRCETAMVAAFASKWDSPAVLSSWRHLDENRGRGCARRRAPDGPYHGRPGQKASSRWIGGVISIPRAGKLSARATTLSAAYRCPTNLLDPARFLRRLGTQSHDDPAAHDHGGSDRSAQKVWSRWK
jgi:hypothetical protein